MVTGARPEFDKDSPVPEDLARAETYLRMHRPWDTVFGSLATALAGGAAAVGPSATELLGGWRPLCFLVAGLAVIGTMASALHKGMGMTDRVADAQQYIASLRSLSLTAAFLEPVPAGPAIPLPGGKAGMKAGSQAWTLAPRQV